jgi:peptidylamidoglycolate lyase
VKTWLASTISSVGKSNCRWPENLFAMPHGLTIDAHDNVWLTDVALQQVYKFSPEGQLLLTLGERGVAGADLAHFNRPTAVAVAGDGSPYVSDGYNNSRVMKFSADGKFLFQWGTKGSGPGQFDLPHWVAIACALMNCASSASNMPSANDTSSPDLSTITCCAI